MWYYRQQKAQVQLNTGLASKRLNQELLGLSELHGGTISMVYYRSLERNNQKPFWRYIYSQGNDRAGVAPLKDGGELFSSSKDKAGILNRQFSSVFTADYPGSSVQLIGPSVPVIDNLSTSAAGVHKLLSKINPSKAAVPDDMPCRVLKELSHELAPVLSAIYTRSLTSGSLPSQWLTANISPVFKRTCHVSQS